tara:strand:- start:78 stop:287 length:210 start_codon:yes stop_codon:yes gene_type:complete
MKESLKMLNQIIERAKIDDLLYKKQMIENHEASKAVGESWMIFHLKILKGLIEKENNEEEKEKDVHDSL